MKLFKECSNYLAIAAFAVLSIQACENSEFTGTSETKSRETVQDRIAIIQDSVVWKIPAVSRLCNELDLKKSRIDIGGCNLYVEEEGNGVPIVLLHGGPGSTHHEFHPSFSEAARYARIIYYDQRGCGLSDRIPGEGYSVQQAAEDLDKLREELGIEKWIVAGHSYGGFLAQYYTTLYPKRILGLVIICGSTGLHRKDALDTRQYDFLSLEEQTAMRKFGSDIRKLGKEKSWSDKEILALTVFNNNLNGDWKRQSFYKPTEAEMARAALYNWDHDLENNFNRQMSRSLKTVSLAGAYNNCPIPTLIMESVWDLTWSEAKALVLAKNHPNSELIVFTKSAHSPYDDEPKAFFRSLQLFTKSIKQVDPDKLHAYDVAMKNFKPSLNDKFLTDPISPEESSALAEFEETKLLIEGGEKYFDLSTPLHVHLSYLSVLKHKDLTSARKLQAGTWTLDRLSDYSYWFDEISVWRAPVAPEKPQQGQIWPVYVINNKTGKWDDTLVFIFWDGIWQKAGNEGGPYYDWRGSELFFIKDLFSKLN